LQPGIKLRRLPLADQGREILGEVDRLGHLGMLLPELGELLGLGLGLSALRLTPRSTNQAARRSVRGGDTGSATIGSVWRRP
jgi:hypothetical protein